MFSKKFFLLLFLWTLSSTYPDAAAYSQSLKTDQFYKLSTFKTDNPLAKMPRQKGTVGVILAYKHKGEIYFLLGRENIQDSNLEKAGRYCDLGGSIKLNGTTILHNLLRELNEESMEQFNISQDDLLKRGYLIYKASKTGRDIFYVFYVLPSDAHLLTKAEELNNLRSRLKKGEVPDSWLEKDNFMWINVKDLLNTPQDDKEIKVTSINAATVSIKLRKYFLEDCIKHPAFADLLKALEQSS